MEEKISRYHAAKSQMIACGFILSSPSYVGREDAMVMPLMMLTGFSLELYFKSWLLEKNQPSSVVRKYGHDLKTLYCECQLNGLSIRNLNVLNDMVAPGHKNMTFRYINAGDSIPLLNWRVAMQLLYDLDYTVDLQIGASASHGITPARGLAPASWGV